MKNSIKLAVLAIIVLILAVGMTGCVTSDPAPTTAPTAAPTAAPTVTAAPTAKPAAVAPTDSNIVGLEAHWNAKSEVIAAHFVKTTVDSKTAYKGTITDSVGTYTVTDILTSTDAQAVSYADTLLARYEAQGFTVQSDNGSHQYVVLKGSTTVGISAYGVIYGTTSPGVGVIERTV